MLRMMCTLLEPSEGRIIVNGHDTLQEAMKIKPRIGVLFVGETGLYDRLTARENLMYFSDLYGQSQHETKNRIEKLSVQFGIKEYLDRRLLGFSRGMRQQVAIARTFVHEPDIILFDEPTTGLDYISQCISSNDSPDAARRQNNHFFNSYYEGSRASLFFCDNAA